jgi:uncharacterized phage-like protein YoqJ
VLRKATWRNPEVKFNDHNLIIYKFKGKKMLILAGTGHRPSKLGGYELPNPIYNYVCQETEKVLKEIKPDKVVSGMALGFDSWLAWISHRLGIPFIATIPFEGQEKKWPYKAQKLYHKLISLATEVIIVSPGGYSVEKMQIRNEFLVNLCDKLLAIWDGTPGGTGNCVNYARGVKNANDIICINPTLTPNQSSL